MNEKPIVNSLGHRIRINMATLKEIGQHLPEGTVVREKFVIIFHEAIRELQDDLKQDFSKCLIPDSELRHELEGTSTDEYGARQHYYSAERYCDRAVFLIKLSIAISYLNTLSQDINDATLPMVQRPK